MAGGRSTSMRRVLVIGCGGAGKSTFASALGRLTALPVVHLDQEYWQPAWAATPAEVWERRIATLVEGRRWILDGNYGATLAPRLAACDTVIFLDLPRALCVWRVIRRWWRYRGQERPDMSAGCPERLSWEFLRWIWTYPRRRRPAILSRLAALGTDQRAVVLRSRAEVAAFLRLL